MTVDIAGMKNVHYLFSSSRREQVRDLRMASDLAEKCAFELARHIHTSTVSELILIAARLSEISEKLSKNSVSSPELE